MSCKSRHSIIVIFPHETLAELSQTIIEQAIAGNFVTIRQVCEWEVKLRQIRKAVFNFPQPLAHPCSGGIDAPNDGIDGGCHE